MIYINGQFPSIEKAAGSQAVNKSVNSDFRTKDNQSFADILNIKKNSEADGELKFSKHASNRLSERNISLSQSQMERLTTSVKAAGEKGINESLVMVDQVAFIVNVKNQTVITALDQNEANTNVFTNIDGAVIA